MTQISTTPDILVGIDGSEQSQAALEWAVTEARFRKVGLQLVHVCEAGSYGLWTTTRTLRAGLRELTQPIVNHAVGRARELDPDLAVRGRLVLGSTLPSLLRIAERAQLIVVGRQGRGALRAHLPGTVTQRLMELARCPVVMVPAG
ncbi:MAG: universal stress protein, partial [Jatrophihabitantaceae bacterium]